MYSDVSYCSRYMYCSPKENSQCGYAIQGPRPECNYYTHQYSDPRTRQHLPSLLTRHRRFQLNRQASPRPTRSRCKSFHLNYLLSIMVATVSTWIRGVAGIY
ncbi:MAG: hypothetical protein DDT28_00648 [Dehalococcoidia bacterium]|nr:hypothetical protein [Chloroflexota bacterium]